MIMGGEAGDVGHRGSMDAPKAPNHMQTQEGMKGKPAQIPTVSKNNLNTMHGQPLHP